MLGIVIGVCLILVITGVLIKLLRETTYDIQKCEEIHKWAKEQLKEMEEND